MMLYHQEVCGFLPPISVKDLPPPQNFGALIHILSQRIVETALNLRQSQTFCVSLMQQSERFGKHHTEYEMLGSFVDYSRRTAPGTIPSLTGHILALHGILLYFDCNPPHQHLYTSALHQRSVPLDSNDLWAECHLVSDSCRLFYFCSFHARLVCHQMQGYCFYQRQVVIWSHQGVILKMQETFYRPFPFHSGTLEEPLILVVLVAVTLAQTLFLYLSPFPPFRSRPPSHPRQEIMVDPSHY
mmetsp:Transcript_6299/g.7983  ORF Transcript_6299/g.7983 Transcript_6299/m.7983 type:complete len:242 (+) Transcript_6299:1239-1964(+)